MNIEEFNQIFTEITGCIGVNNFHKLPIRCNETTNIKETSKMYHGYSNI